MSYKKKLVAHLIEGKTEEVFKALTVLADQMGNNILMNDVVNQYMKYQQLSLELENGTLSEKAFQYRLKKINQVLILLIEQFP